jgi:hypothetical protein
VDTGKAYEAKLGSPPKPLPALPKKLNLKGALEMMGEIPAKYRPFLKSWLSLFEPVNETIDCLAAVYEEIRRDSHGKR